MRDVDRYFEMVLGMAVDGLGGCVRTPLRLEAQPPFLLSCEILKKSDPRRFHPKVLGHT